MEANELKITPITKEALWESSIEEHHLSSLVPLLLPPSVPATSLSTYKDRGLQTDKRLDFNIALKQLQVVTWVKSQLKSELLHKQHKQDTKEDELIAAHKREISARFRAKAVQKEIDKMMLQFQEDATK